MTTEQMLIIIGSILIPILSGLGWIISILMEQGQRLSRLEGFIEGKKYRKTGTDNNET
jgi:hypothetical protein